MDEEAGSLSHPARSAAYEVSAIALSAHVCSGRLRTYVVRDATRGAAVPVQPRANSAGVHIVDPADGEGRVVNEVVRDIDLVPTACPTGAVGGRTMSAEPKVEDAVEPAAMPQGR